jgi:hypothetical protein
MFPPQVAPEGAGRVVYARAGEDDGLADGSIGRPFATLRRAVQDAGVGGVVLLAAGTYSEHVTLQQRVKVIGRCAGSVVIEGRDASEEGVVMVRGGDAVVELRGVTIRGETRGVAISGGARVALREVVVDQARNAGVSVAGAGSNARVERSIVRRTLPRLDDGASFAVSVIEGATGLFVESALFDSGALGFGARVRDEGSLGTFRDVFVRGRNDAGRPTALQGVIAGIQSRVVLERTVIDGFDTSGASSDAPSGMIGGRLEARDLVIRGVQSRTPGGSSGMDVGRGGAIDAERTLIEDVQGFGAFSGMEGSSLTLRNSAVRRVRPAIGQRFGVCAFGGSHGVLSLHRVRLEDCAEGVLVATSASGTVQNSQIARTSIGGVGVNHPGTTLDVRDTLIDTVRSEALSNGVGVIALSGARLNLSRVRVRRCLAMGAMVMAEGARMEVRDSIFSEIEGSTARKQPMGEIGTGFGLTAGGEGEILAEQVAIVDSGGAGVAAIQGITRDDREVYNARIEATDLFVRGVRERSLFTDTMARSPPVSIGYYAADRSSVRVAHGVVCGAQYGAYTTSGAFSFEDVVFHEVSRCGVSSNQPTVPPMLRSVRFYGAPRELCEDEVIGNIIVPTIDLGPTP